MQLTSKITLRPYRPADDIDSLSEIICRCLREVNSKDYPAEEITKMCEEFSPRSLRSWLSEMESVIVVVDGQSLVGTGALKGDYIMSVFVLPDEHGKGIGSKIMDHLEHLAVQVGHKLVNVNSSISSYEFYKKREYLEAGRIRRKIGVEMILMKKSLE